MTKSETVNTRSISRAISAGVLGGVVGSIAMAMYAMIISSVKDIGFFTPLYHIASTFISQNAMMTSMAQDMEQGSSGYFDLGPAAVGVIVHMMTGAIAGAVFGAIISKIHASRAVTVVAGTMFGLLVMVVNGFIGLPIVSNLFGGGEPISDMAKMVGWGHFTVQHEILEWCSELLWRSN